MDTQLKRGMLEAVVLALLLKGDSYGYLLVRQAAGAIELSESTLYPVLRRLEGAGQVSAYTQEHSGRLRKYYRITPLGEEKVQQFLADFQQVHQVYQLILASVQGQQAEEENQ